MFCKEMMIVPNAPPPIMGGMRTFYVYIMASRSRVLYVGVTNDLARAGRTSTSEVWPASRAGIASPDSSIKKTRLIDRRNPTWEDLSALWHS
jgi:hypothetical protein